MELDSGVFAAKRDEVCDSCFVGESYPWMFCHQAIEVRRSASHETDDKERLFHWLWSGVGVLALPKGKWI